MSTNIRAILWTIVIGITAMIGITLGTLHPQITQMITIVILAIAIITVATLLLAILYDSIYIHIENKKRRNHG